MGGVIDGLTRLGDQHVTQLTFQTRCAHTDEVVAWLSFGQSLVFWLDASPSAREKMCAWYCKPGGNPMTGVGVGPSRKATTAVLISGRGINVPF